MYFDFSELMDKGSQMMPIQLVETSASDHEHDLDSSELIYVSLAIVRYAVMPDNTVMIRITELV